MSWSQETAPVGMFTDVVVWFPLIHWNLMVSPTQALIVSELNIKFCTWIITFTGGPLQGGGGGVGTKGGGGPISFVHPLHANNAKLIGNRIRGNIAAILNKLTY